VREAHAKRLDQEMQAWDAKGRYATLTRAQRDWIEADPTGRRKRLAFDLDKKQYKVDEAKAAIEAEAQLGELERDINPSTGDSDGGDFIDRSGQHWEVKQASDGAASIIDRARAGENIIVDCTGLTPEAKASLVQQVQAGLPPGAGRVIFVGGPAVP
jgi:hypothetical protein